MQRNTSSSPVALAHQRCPIQALNDHVNPDTVIADRLLLPIAGHGRFAAVTGIFFHGKLSPCVNAYGIIQHRCVLSCFAERSTWVRTGTLSSSYFGKCRGLPHTRTVFATTSRSCPPEPGYPVSCMTTTIPRGTIAISAASRMRIRLGSAIK